MGSMVYTSCPLLTSPSLPSQFQPPSGIDLFLFIGVYLIYHAVLVSGVQQSESVMCIHISTLLGFPGSSTGEESTYNARDPSLIPGPGGSPGERIGDPLQYSWAFLVAQVVKNLPAVRETWVPSLGLENPLEEGITTHSSILA